MRIRALIVCGCVTAGLATGVQAQASPLQISAGVRLEAYSFSDPASVGIEKVALLSTPISARVGITRQLELQVAGAFARGAVTRSSGAERSLSGLTDTEVRLTALLARDRLRLSAIGLVPSGVTNLTTEEMDVAGVIAADLLPFAISNWGTGGGFGLSAAAALPLSEESSFGVSAGYVVAAEFEPLDNSDIMYRPGNQLQARAAFDHTFGVAGKLSLSLTYLKYGADESRRLKQILGENSSGSENLFQAGDRLQGLASYAFAAGTNATALLYAGYLRRQEGEFTALALVAPAQDLVFGGAGLRLPAGRTVLQPSVDLRLVGSEDGVDHGYTLSAGSSIELPLGRALLVPQARARFGRLTVRTGQASGFTGFELGVSLRNRALQP